MSTVRKATGNMYDWVTHLWSPGKGCSHDCSYCYMKHNRFLPDPGTKFVIDPVFPRLGNGRVIFVGHTCDMWAEDVPSAAIQLILEHCSKFENDYVFQTKNPERYITQHMTSFINRMKNKQITLGPTIEITLGTTIETNRWDILQKVSSAPHPIARSTDLAFMRIGADIKTFVTVEPIMKFDVNEFSHMLIQAQPDWINIGADSKRQHLPEPSKDQVLELIAKLRQAGIEVREKTNLKRLIK